MATTKAPIEISIDPVYDTPGILYTAAATTIAIDTLAMLFLTGFLPIPDFPMVNLFSVPMYLQPQMRKKRDSSSDLLHLRHLVNITSKLNPNESFMFDKNEVIKVRKIKVAKSYLSYSL